MTAPPSPLARVQLTFDEARLSGVVDAVGTATARQTATLVPFFGPTVAGHGRFLENMPFDAARTTLGQQAYHWNRGFRLGEPVDALVTLDDVAPRSRVTLYVVRSAFTDASGHVIQTQHTTFVERNG